MPFQIVPHGSAELSHDQLVTRPRIASAHHTDERDDHESEVVFKGIPFAAPPTAEAVNIANAAAALSVTKLEALPSAPTRNDIESFLAGRR